MTAPDPTFISFYDFHYLWAAGRIALDQGNPYDLETLRHYLAQTGWPASEDAVTFSHPPNALLFYMIIALLPYTAASWAWFAISLLLVGLCLKIWFDQGESPISGALPIEKLLFATLLFPPLFATLLVGQTNFFLLAGITLFSLFFRQERWLLAGCALSLSTLKPHLFLPFYAAIFVHALISRKGFFPLSTGFISGIAAQIFLSFCLYPAGVANYLACLPLLLGTASDVAGVSIGQILSNQFDIQSTANVWLGMGLAAGIILGWQRNFSLRVALNKVLPISLLTCLYTWPHSFIVLLLPYLQIATHWFRKSERFGQGMVIALFIVGFLDVIVPLRLGFLQLIIPLGVFFLSPATEHPTKAG